MKKYYSIDIDLCRDSEISPTEMMVLENIDFLSKYTGWCEASKKDLASHHDMTDRGFFKLRNRLEERKLIQLNKKGHIKTTKKYAKLVSSKYHELSSDDELSSEEQSSDLARNKVPISTYKKDISVDSSKTFSFNLEKSMQYDLLSDEYKSKLKAYSAETGDTNSSLLDAMIDYHISRGTKFKDWSAAFRTWKRNDEKFNKVSVVADDGKPRIMPYL